MTSSSYTNTLVSAFITGINTRKDIDISNYIEFGKKFLEINVPKVIFMELIFLEKQLLLLEVIIKQKIF